MALWIITGPPAAGKSTWVTARAKVGDVVVDMDRIAQALTAPGADYHRYDRDLRTVAQGARHGAITAALRVSARLDVYVIETQPSEQALARYLGHGARVVRVDPGRDVVLARCAEQRSPSVLAAVDRWYSVNSDQHVESQSGSRSW